MINHTTVLAQSENADSQMLWWTDTTRSADRKSWENPQQAYTAKCVG